VVILRRFIDIDGNGKPAENERCELASRTAEDRMMLIIFVAFSFMYLCLLSKCWLGGRRTPNTEEAKQQNTKLQKDLKKLNGWLKDL